LLLCLPSAFMQSGCSSRFVVYLLARGTINGAGPRNYSLGYKTKLCCPPVVFPPSFFFNLFPIFFSLCGKIGHIEGEHDEALMSS